MGQEIAGDIGLLAEPGLGHVVNLEHPEKNSGTSRLWAGIVNWRIIHRLSQRRSPRDNRIFASGISEARSNHHRQQSHLSFMNPSAC